LLDAIDTFLDSGCLASSFLHARSLVRVEIQFLLLGKC